MSRDRKQASSNLLPPSIFLSSVHQLNIFAQTPQIDSSTSSSTSSSLKSNTASNNNKTNPVVYTNEAIELLRQCHGQFLSLVSSELASCERKNNDDSEKKKKQSRKRKVKGAEVIANTGTTSGDGNYEEGDVRTILPQHVLEALENLEFHFIASKLRLLMDGSKTDNAQSSFVQIRNQSDGKYSESKSKTCKKESRKRKKESLKKALGNASMTAELLAEQEKLFAMSAAKAKLKSGQS